MYLCIYLSIRVGIYLYVSYLFIRLGIYYLSIYLSIVCLSTQLSFNLLRYFNYLSFLYRYAFKHLYFFVCSPSP